MNGGVRQVNVLMNLGVADYDGLQTQVSYRGNARIFAAVSYTLSKATNTSEPDGNGIGPNESNIARLGEVERGPSLLDQRHRAVITFSYQFPYNITAGTVTQLASARPFNATTGVDNNGDGAQQRPPGRRRPGDRQVDVPRHPDVRRGDLRRGPPQAVGRNRSCSGWRASTSSTTANYLGRGQTTYGDTGTPNDTFGQLVSVGTTTNAIPAFANIDPPRMFQLQLRYLF